MLSKSFINILSKRFSTLTMHEAQNRADLIRKNTLDYSCHLTLHKGHNYEGLININFQTQNTPPQQDSLKIDFQGKTVTKIMINQHLVSQPSQLHRPDGLYIPHSLLKINNRNNILVQYINEYDKDGNGCVSFIDVDGKQYLYTQFQPYFANRVFPIFDQPDLKANLALSISCPSEWDAVLSNEFALQNPSKRFTVSEITKKVIHSYLNEYSSLVKDYQNSIPSDYKITQFRQTKLLPSYLYCFVVGPYKQLAINLSSKTNAVPMRLYSIQSLYPQMQALAPYIQQVTVKSMNFFQQYFGYAYPFSKYDQVFAHEYKWGAMQNAGIVTFNDFYLFKDKVSDERLLSFGNTIVHQLSHHWFGNLVTMKWWDDLWLNESFADYISHFCLEKIKKQITTLSYESSMLSFFSRKGWGYTEDQMITTHPIRSQVDDTFKAESIFDGITYSKGAATMKQLMYLLGEQAFSSALKDYFKKYEFSNAVLDDLLTAIQPHFTKLNLGFSLAEWKKMWLQSAGTNILNCEWQKGAKSITVHQTADRADCATLRVHRIKIALIQQNHRIIVKQALIHPSQRTELALDVPTSTVAVLLNYDDLTFAKVKLDPVSRTYFSQNLHNVQDVLSRAIVWKSYFSMMRDSVIPSNEYIDFTIANIEAEKSDSIFQQQISHLHAAISLYTPHSPPIFRKNLYEKVYSFLKSLLLKLKDQQSNRKVILRDKLIDFADSHQAKHELYQWYKGHSADFAAQPLNNTLRWKIILKLFTGTTLADDQKWQLFNDMKTRDSSDTMINKRLTCLSLTANDVQLSAIYNSFFDQNNKLSLTNRIHQMRGINNSAHRLFVQNHLTQSYFHQVSKYLTENVSEEQKWFLRGDYLQNFIVHMDPAQEGTHIDLKSKVIAFEQLLNGKNQKIKRIILKKIDLLQRRIKAYHLFKQNYLKNI